MESHCPSQAKRDAKHSIYVCEEIHKHSIYANYKSPFIYVLEMKVVKLKKIEICAPFKYFSHTLLCRT